MADLLWINVAIPITIFLVMAFFGKDIPRPLLSFLAAGGTGISAVLTLILAWSFLNHPPADGSISTQLWSWMIAGGLKVPIALRLDMLSLVFTFVITFVGFLILVYSTEFMKDDDGYPRFFAFMNLFIGSMLILVLADNLLLMYMGWEGVGLCSFLLIGFWYKDPANGYAARKAFIMTRVGDTALIIGIFLLYAEFGTLRIEEILAGAPELWEFASPTATLAAFLLLGGAIGKSAQLPLQTWLPDAMAGPSPVSALIHAATMVTAGVYLIARTHAIFEMAPMAQSAVAIIGAATLLVAGFSALTQKDIKRILAYSTMSQIGYMFLALGVGAWSAAVFHFMIHAFFKALLFLGAGAIIMVLHHEHDIFKMGGLYKRLPKIFWTFLIASASLAALPIISAGFYSKDLILWETFASTKGSTLLWALGFVGAFITALYTFRMVFVTFFNKLGIEPTHRPGLQITIPLLILAFFSFAGGFIELPHTLGEVQWFSGVMHQVLPAFEPRPVNENSEWILQLITGLSSLLAVALAYLLYIRKHSLVEQWRNSLLGAGLNRFWYGGWGFDTLYQHLFIIPLESISRINKDDVIDLLALGSTKIIVFFNGVLVGTQSGKMRWYMAAITLGAVIILTLVVML